MADQKKISLALGAKKKEAPRKPTHINGTKRPHAALHDSDDEDAPQQHQEVTHFDQTAGGAIHAAKVATPKELLIIPAMESSRKRQRSNLPSRDTEAAEAAVAEARVKAKPITFGLNVQGKSTEQKGSTTNEEAVDDQIRGHDAPPKKTIDEQAMDALLGKQNGSSTIIPALTEEETFLRDYEQAPDAPSLADYDAVPIEEFGAAMLRGMGWKDGETIGKSRGQQPVKQRVIERRPELLGVGAKPAKALGIELGEWGKHAKKHERKIDQAYAPVVLKNKKTGELVTEDELQAKLKEQEEQKYALVEEEGSKKERRLEYRSSKDSRRDRREDDHYHSKDRHRSRDRDRDRDYDDRKHRSHRDRSSSASRRRDKERRYRDGEYSSRKHGSDRERSYKHSRRDR